MKRAKRVYTIFYGYLRSGQYARLSSLVETLLEDGYEVHCLSAYPLRLAPHKNLQVHLIPFLGKKPRGFMFWFRFTCFAPVYFLFKAICKPASCTLAFDTYYSVVALFGGLLTFSPTVLFLNAIPWHADKVLVRTYIRRVLIYLFDLFGILCSRHVVVPTQYAKQELITALPFSEKRIHKLPNAVVYPKQIKWNRDSTQHMHAWETWLAAFPKRKQALIERFALPEECFILSTSGEVHSRKNLEPVIRAIASCESTPIILLVCGTGPEAIPLSSIVRGLGLVDAVIFTGWLENPVEVFSGADIFIRPEQDEDIAHALLEALGSGLPVLAADCPEMRELLHYEELLIDANHVEKLAKRFSELSANKKSYERLRSLSHQRTKELTFSWGDEVIGFLNSCVYSKKS